MALTVTLTGTTVTLDETAGLQNDDTNAALPAAFSSRLTALGADPATAINAAVSNGNVISISGVTGTLATSPSPMRTAARWTVTRAVSRPPTARRSFFSRTR